MPTYIVSLPLEPLPHLLYESAKLTSHLKVTCKEDASPEQVESCVSR